LTRRESLGGLISLILKGLAPPALWGDTTSTSFLSALGEVNFRNGRFVNPWGVPSRDFKDFLKWVFGLEEREDPPFPYDPKELRLPSVRTPDWERIRNPDPGALQVTWFGHSTFLIQYRGVTVLTDPILSRIAGPGNLIGSKRLIPTVADPGDLPPLDLVLISHNHYDHCDLGTLRRLPRDTPIAVPLRVGELLRKEGFSKVEEWGWGRREPIREGFILHCVPAQHFSGRGLTDRNETLWCGYALELYDLVLYFAGDTGYGPFFSEIGRFYGGITLAFLPIGAYRPRWFMGPVHVDPPEAVLVHKEIQARYSIGMHWGTFSLAEEPPGEPPLYLRWALEREGVLPDRFFTMEVGETRILST